MITFEYAFVTATRIRDNALDDQINNAILTIEIISLPFAFVEFAAAKGLVRLYRGFILAIDIEAITITFAGEGDFEAGCSKIFGPTLGPKIFPWLNTMNAVIGITQLVEIVGPSGMRLLETFDQEQLIETAATAEYLAKTEKYVGNIMELEEYNELITIRSQIEINLGINDVADAPDLVDDVSDVFIGFAENGVGNSILRSNEKYEELMIKYQYWKKTEANQGDLMHADEFLQGLSLEDREVLDLMLSDELADAIIGTFKSDEVIKNSHKMKALKKLAKNNVCQL